LATDKKVWSKSEKDHTFTNVTYEPQEVSVDV